MKVLIVDDIEAVRLAVRRTLVNAGFAENDVFEADGGQAAIVKLRAHAPELVLSDWSMPTMSGLELLAQVRAEARPVVFGFLSSEQDDEVRRRARLAGADFFLEKPLTETAIRSTLRALEPTFRRHREASNEDRRR